MKSTAATVMTTEFPTFYPDTPLTDAIHTFRSSFQKHGRRLFGVMVTDRNNHLAGMLSMYDILLYLRPKHIQVWGGMDDLDIDGLLEAAGERLKAIQVGDIMTTEVITVEQHVDLLVILDIMIKKHVRRLPVVSDGGIVGIVYISDVFNHLLERIGD